MGSCRGGAGRSGRDGGRPGQGAGPVTTAPSRDGRTDPKSVRIVDLPRRSHRRRERTARCLDLGLRQVPRVLGLDGAGAHVAADRGRGPGARPLAIRSEASPPAGLACRRSPAMLRRFSGHDRPRHAGMDLADIGIGSINGAAERRRPRRVERAVREPERVGHRVRRGCRSRTAPGSGEGRKCRTLGGGGYSCPRRALGTDASLRGTLATQAAPLARVGGPTLETRGP